ncbi:MAG: hypothetical protein ACFE89_12655 [Candidatus Hodarchaeota archaeon]
MLEEFEFIEEDPEDPGYPEDPEVPEAPEAPEALQLIEPVVYIGLSVITLLGGMWIVHKHVSKEGE